ncbi:MAG: phosphate ABC transporter substrate-binding protein [bacterium]|nr:phosphate ABC transporter substrate-binding protein [bacterium]
MERPRTTSPTAPPALTGRARVLVLAVISVFLGALRSQEIANPRPSGATVDRRLPAYRPIAKITGQIRSVGSDTMNDLLTSWSEGFHRLYPDVAIEIEARGSGTAPSALQSGRATFGAMSRPMKRTAVEAFEKAHGYAPLRIAVGLDMIAVYVHRDNPLRSLTLPQVDAIFGVPPRATAVEASGGGRKRDRAENRARSPRRIKTWGDLGLTGPWAKKDINLHGRDRFSGTGDYFRKHVLSGAEFKPSVRAQKGTAAVVEAVATDRFAMGFAGIGAQTGGVRAVPLARSAADVVKREIYEAVPKNAYNGDYPLSRFLLLYVDYEPDSEMDALRREFLTYILSKRGQREVVAEGYLSLPFRIAAAQRAKFR